MLVVVLVLNRSKNPMIRMSSIVGGIMVGYLVAWYMGIVNFGYMTGLPFVNIPIPFNYGFALNWTAFIGVAFIYLITTIDYTGHLTATSMHSDDAVERRSMWSASKAVFREMESTLQKCQFSTLSQTQPSVKTMV